MDLEVHRALAGETARASVTLVRDPGAGLPRRIGPDQGVLLIAPVPVDLTPAETSSYVELALADALRKRGVGVHAVVAPLDPDPAAIAALVETVADHDVVLVATFYAVSFPGQGRLVRAVSGRGRGATCIAIALRTPYDVAVQVHRRDLHLRHPGSPDGGSRRRAPRHHPFAGTLPVELPSRAAIPAGWSRP
jgi:beta-N-acetylhexosaminidase